MRPDRLLSRRHHDDLVVRAGRYAELKRGPRWRVSLAAASGRARTVGLARPVFGGAASRGADRIRARPARLLCRRSGVGARGDRHGFGHLVLARHVVDVSDHDRRRQGRRQYRHVVRGPHPQTQLRRGDDRTDPFDHPDAKPHRSCRRCRHVPRTPDAPHRAGQHHHLPSGRRTDSRVSYPPLVTVLRGSDGPAGIRPRRRRDDSACTEGGTSRHHLRRLVRVRLWRPANRADQRARRREPSIRSWFGFPTTASRSSATCSRHCSAISPTW